MKETEKNCRNCGAPLDENGDCEYCGTKRQRSYESEIVISADSIRFIAGELRNYPPQIINRT